MLELIMPLDAFIFLDVMESRELVGVLAEAEDFASVFLIVNTFVLVFSPKIPVPCVSPSGASISVAYFS